MDFISVLKYTNTCYEINCSGLTKSVYNIASKKLENNKGYMDFGIISMGIKEKIDFTIGSDAHSPDLLFANVREVSQKLEELGLTEVKYFKDLNSYSFIL